MNQTEKTYLTIETLINNGSGLARLPTGQVVFVKGTLPGERVSLTLHSLEKQKGVLWATDYELLESSPHRTEPNCPYFYDCGGCATLHIQPKHELLEKVGAVRDVLQRLAKWSQSELVCIDFPQTSSRFRGKFHAEGSQFGWKSERSHDIVPISRCHVLPNSVQASLASISRAVEQSEFQGEIYFAAHPQTQKVILRFQGTANNIEPIGKLQVEASQITGITWATGSGRPKRQWGDPKLSFQWQSFQVAIRAAQFFQSNPASWSVFHKILQRYLTVFNPSFVWDVHAGSGFLSAGLGDRDGFVSEPDALAFSQLKRNVKTLAGNVSAFQGTAEQALRSRQEPHRNLQGAILDPPRAGLTKPLRKWLISKGPPSLLYFSCDIATFARDVAQLGQAYDPVKPAFVLNVNPGTLRVEVAAMFKRR